MDFVINGLCENQATIELTRFLAFSLFSNVSERSGKCPTNPKCHWNCSALQQKIWNFFGQFSERLCFTSIQVQGKLREMRQGNIVLHIDKLSICRPTSQSNHFETMPNF
jgi:hypothetical protein